MERIPNLESWFNNLKSEEELDVENIKLGYEYALTSLFKVSTMVIDEYEREQIFNSLDQSIKDIRQGLENSFLKDSDLKLKLLDNFELFLRRHFTVDNSTYRKPLIWNGEKGALAEVFMLLKDLKTKEGKSYLGNTVEDIALFLKANFDVYQETKLSTIQGTLKRIPSKNVYGETKVKISIDG